MAIDVTKMPSDPAARAEHCRRKLELYFGMKVNGLRSAGSMLKDYWCDEHYSDEDLRADFGHFRERIIEPYRGLDLSKLDDPVEFSFVYTMKDIFDEMEDAFRRIGERSPYADLREHYRNVIGIGGLAICTVGNIWERNVMFYQAELQKLEGETRQA